MQIKLLNIYLIKLIFYFNHLINYLIEGKKDIDNYLIKKNSNFLIKINGEIEF